MAIERDILPELCERLTQSRERLRDHGVKKEAAIDQDTAFSTLVKATTRALIEACPEDRPHIMMQVEYCVALNEGRFPGGEITAAVLMNILNSAEMRKS